MNMRIFHHLFGVKQHFSLSIFFRERLDCFELLTFATVATKGFMFGSAAEFIREAENIYQRNKGVMSTMLNADGSKANFDEIIQTFKRNIVSFHNK